MPNHLKRSALVTAVFAAYFYGAFMLAKHDPSLREIIPFGEDPYDAVGSFAVVVAAILALIGLFRAFRPFRSGGPSPRRIAYLVRTLAAVALAALLTVAADAVAMARHPSLWLGARGGGELLVLLGVTSAAASALLLHLTRSRATARRGPWLRAAVVTSVAVAVLALYPEDWILRPGLHLLTVVVGDLLLFAQIRPLLTALVPMDATQGDRESGSPGDRLRHRGLRWMVVAALGLAVGVFAFVGEMSEGGGSPPPLRAAVVAAVFMGLATAGLLIAYALLGKPLGLGEG